MYRNRFLPWRDTVDTFFGPNPERGYFSISFTFFLAAIEQFLKLPYRTVELLLDQKGLFVSNDHLLSRLPDEVKSTLLLGPKFQYPARYLYNDFLTDWKLFTRRATIFHCFKDDTKTTEFNPKLYKKSTKGIEYDDPDLSFFLENSKAKLNTMVKDIQKVGKKTPRMFREALHAMKWFNDNKDIVVATADKNLGIVVLYKEQYTEYCKGQINSTTFAPTDLTKATLSLKELKLDNEFKELVRNIVKHNNIPITSKYNFEQFLTQFAKEFTLPEFYILVKVHKDPWKARPIQPCHSYFTTPISIWLVEILLPITKRLESILGSTDQLLRDISKYNANMNPPSPNEWCIFSIDVESLYPSINLDKAIPTIHSYIMEHQEELNIPKPLVWVIFRALNFVLKNNYTEFQGVIYKQVTGTAMGANVAPPFANLYLAIAVDQHMLQTQELSFYRRFIDDTILVTKRPFANTILEKATKLFEDQDLQITYTDVAASVDFLDVTVSVNASGKLSYTPYAKSISMFLYLPFSSFHREPQKIALITNELNRLWKLSNNVESCFIEHARMFYVNLRARGYPDKFIQQAITKFEKKRNSTADSSPVPTIEATTTLPAPRKLFYPITNSLLLREAEQKGSYLTLTRQTLSSILNSSLREAGITNSKVVVSVRSGPHNSALFRRTLKE